VVIIEAINYESFRIASVRVEAKYLLEVTLERGSLQ